MKSYTSAREKRQEVVAREERQRTLDKWQLSSENETGDRWIAQFTGNLGAWLNRKHGEIDYFLTQFLSAHGGFQSCLHKIGKARSPNCVFCNEVMDDAHHTFFSCGRLDGFRQQLYLNTGDLSSDNIVEEMLRGADRWSCVAHYVRVLLVAKKIELDRWRSRSWRGVPSTDSLLTFISSRWQKEFPGLEAPQVGKVRGLARSNAINGSRLALGRWGGV